MSKSWRAGGPVESDGRGFRFLVEAYRGTRADRVVAMTALRGKRCLHMQYTRQGRLRRAACVTGRTHGATAGASPTAAEGGRLLGKPLLGVPVATRL